MDLRGGTPLALLALFVVAVASLLISPYPAESFNSIRKNLCYQTILFFVSHHKRIQVF